MSTRGDLLREAIEIIDGDRNVQYGEPTADFQRTADLLNAIEFTVSGKPLLPHHIAIIGIALKLSRMTWSPEKYDHWLDVAGYAGCGWECASRFGTTGAEQEDGESLDQLLAEEQPDLDAEPDEERLEDIAGDPEAADEELDGKVDESGEPAYSQPVFIDGEWIEHLFDKDRKYLGKRPYVYIPADNNVFVDG